MTDRVVIRCKNTGWRQCEKYEYESEYVGTILPNYPIDGDDVISLSTDFPAWRNFPRRIIAKKNILSIKKFGTEEAVQMSKFEEKNKTFKIKGSKGDVYTVTQRGSMFTCDCQGYQFRKSCKHIVAAKNGN